MPSSIDMTEDEINQAKMDEANMPLIRAWARSIMGADPINDEVAIKVCLTQLQHDFVVQTNYAKDVTPSQYSVHCASHLEAMLSRL